MVQNIVNGAPMSISLGVNDIPRQAPVYVPEVLPTHLPVVFLYAADGPDGDHQIVDGNAASLIYGADTFDMRKPYATHQTKLANILTARANSFSAVRVRPDDAPDPANARLWLDLLETQIDDYERNEDGSIKLDVNGDPVTTGTKIDGFIAKWVITHIDPDQDGNDMFGKGTIGPGDQTDQTSGTQSKRYPIFDFAYPFFGARGNLAGIRLYAPTEVSSSPINPASLVNDHVYPLRLQLVRRLTPTATPTIQATQSAEQYIDFCLKPGTISSITESSFYMASKFPSSYQLLDDPSGLPNQWGPVGRFSIYQNNIDLVLGKLFAAEKPFIDAFSDFDAAASDADNLYRYNLFSGVSSQNVPYHSIQFNTSAGNAQRLSENSTFYLSGGGDGTMNEADFAVSVAKLAANYADPLSPWLNDAKYPESALWDTGFPLETKYALMSAMSIRKDIAVIISTHDVLGKQLTASEESSLAVALRTRALLYPESDYFGTATMRCVIVGRSGMLINDDYGRALPLTLDLADKVAGWMGSGNGIWKSGGGFDINPANIVSLFKSNTINVTYVPATVRNKDWANGLINVEDFSRLAAYWPAFRTVYPDDTSTLTSIITMFGMVEIEKVGQRVHRRFTGRTDLTEAQLIDRVNQAVIDSTNSRFDGRFLIVPDAYFDDADRQRGYSWHLRIKVGANMMRTVQTLYIEAYRMEDLQAQQGATQLAA